MYRRRITSSTGCPMWIRICAEAAFGALRVDQRIHGAAFAWSCESAIISRTATTVPALAAADLAPLDNDPIALRRQLVGRDRRSLQSSEPGSGDEKSGAEPVLPPTSHLTIFRKRAPRAIHRAARETRFRSQSRGTKRLEKSTALFRTDPKIESLSASFRFRAVKSIFGQYRRHRNAPRITRSISLSLSGSTQADDGMRLDRCPTLSRSNLKDLPTADEVSGRRRKDGGNAESVAGSADGR